MPNKVEFGLSNVNIAPFTPATLEAAAIIGAFQPMPGAVSLKTEIKSESNPFYADDIKYYDSFSDEGESGELTMALIPDWFKIQYLGYKTMADGGVAKISGAEAKPFAMVFEGKGDANKRRHIMYNIMPGEIKRERKTIEGKKEVEVETLPISIVGDFKTGVSRISYNEGDEGYASCLTATSIPAVTVAP